MSPDADLGRVFGPAWAALQSRNPDLPDVVFRPMPGNLQGHGFGSLTTPGRQPDGTHYAELTVLVAPAWLRFGNKYLAFLTLAHEAAHALDYARNGNPSGHGEIFAELARELGLSAEKRTRIPRLGDYDPDLTDSIRAGYAETINALGAALAAAAAAC